MNLFEVKLKYIKTLEDGKEKVVTEVYVVDAFTFTEAEARITKEMESVISGEYEIAAIKKMNISELFQTGNGDKYFQCKVNFLLSDEKSGNEKKDPHYMLVEASDSQMALDVLKEGMNGTMADWETEVIAETKVIEIYLK